jgi:hypothetical protein
MSRMSTAFITTKPTSRRTGKYVRSMSLRTS